MKTCCLLTLILALALSLRAEVVDRIALTIGNQAIVESQIDEELRVTALLNHKPVIRNQDARRDGATRMIQQFLIKLEMEVSHFSQPDTKDLEAYRLQVERDYGGPDGLVAALQRYQLDEAVLRSHLNLQLTALRFITFRFQPQFAANDPDLERRTDEALDAWLTEAKKRHTIVFLDKGLEK